MYSNMFFAPSLFLIFLIFLFLKYYSLVCSVRFLSTFLTNFLISLCSKEIDKRTKTFMKKEDSQEKMKEERDIYVSSNSTAKIYIYIKFQDFSRVN